MAYETGDFRDRLIVIVEEIKRNALIMLASSNPHKPPSL
jgi:hypothetical protein